MTIVHFFLNNMPYGIIRNSKDEWAAFNREYKPLGWNSSGGRPSIIDNQEAFFDIPIFTKYEGLTEFDVLKELADSEDCVTFDSEGKVKIVLLYSNQTNPQADPNYWNHYFNKIKFLSRAK